MESKVKVHEQESFKNIDYSEKYLKNIEFDNCTFQNCIFLKSDLEGTRFEDCLFENCNFSMTKVQGVGFRNATFNGCKVLGVDFSDCNKFMFSFSFNDCDIDYSSFFGTTLIKTIFNKCSLKETDFSEATLTASKFLNCDLAGAIFSNSKLDKVDFRTANNYSIDPQYNQLKKTIFASSNLEGLLDKYQLDIRN